MKSPPPRAFSVPDVHPRPRKRLARCTLDCGFKTPESPALRGFEAERCPITGTSLYLVLKSNGPHCSKNLPVKFDFSSKSVPANIAKKLPPQRCFKPLFNFPHKRLAFAFAPESGYTLGFQRKIAHSGSQGETGAFPPSATARSCAASEIATERTAGGSRCTPMACVRFLRRRGPAGLRDLFSFLSKLRLLRPALRAFRTCERGGAVTTLGALCMFSKRWTAACQKDSFAVF